MLDIKLIKENPDAVKAGLKAKEVDCDAAIDRILELDAQRRSLITDTENKKAQQNKVSKQIPALKKAGQDVASIFAEMAELKNAIAADAEKLDAVEKEYHTLMLSLPNLPGRGGSLSPGVCLSGQQEDGWACPHVREEQGEGRLQQAAPPRPERAPPGELRGQLSGTPA